MTDDKPDPLARLKEIVAWGAATSSDRYMHHGWIEDAIAAWEKERAERESYGLRALKEIAGDWEKCAMKRLAEIQILRVAAKKVRDELRNQALEPPLTVKNALDHADVLDAALGGGA